jgi:hypothetical protein
MSRNAPAVSERILDADIVDPSARARSIARIPWKAISKDAEWVTGVSKQRRPQFSVRESARTRL